MLYTIGHRASYEQGLDDAARSGKPFLKLGRTRDYEGGIVFETAEAAQACLRHIPNGHEYEVYGLRCVLVDTYLHQGGLRYLKQDAPIMRVTQA